MEALLQQLSDWLKGMLVDGIMNNLSGMFDAVNQQVADVATQVGNSPANFSPASPKQSSFPSRACSSRSSPAMS